LHNLEPEQATTQQEGHNFAALLNVVLIYVHLLQAFGVSFFGRPALVWDSRIFQLCLDLLELLLQLFNLLDGEFWSGIASREWTQDWDKLFVVAHKFWIELGQWSLEFFEGLVADVDTCFEKCHQRVAMYIPATLDRRAPFSEVVFDGFEVL
jgi:hypothetical protein